ncbi:MAG: DUF4962 domain-containing protein, partial [Armatimonadota bacterium]
MSTIMCGVATLSVAALGYAGPLEPGEVREIEASPVIEGRADEETWAADASGDDYVFLAAEQLEDAEPHAYIEVPVADVAGTLAVNFRAVATDGASSIWLDTGEGWRSFDLRALEPPAWQWYEVPVRALRPLRRIRIGAREPARLDAVRLERADLHIPPHQSTMFWLEPHSGASPHINPPTFRWPISGDDRYTVQVARSGDFTDIVAEHETQTTFWRPLQPMEPGRYSWRYHASSWSAGEWSAVEQFVVGDGAVRWPLPEWNEAIGRIADDHPRLWFPSEELAALRRLADGRYAAVLSAWRARFDSEIGRKLPLEDEKTPTDYDNQRERIIQLREAKRETFDTIRHMNDMAVYYLLTGDELVGAEVHRRAVLCAGLDPHGWTSHSISNFANSALIAAMAHAYDYCHDLFTADELQALAAATAARMQVVYDAYCPSLEQHLYEAHAWQHIMPEFLVGAIALYRDVPEAAEWLEWALKLSVATYPWWGRQDGGSAECAAYNESSDAPTSMDLRDLIHAATGIDMATNPWYSGNIYYSIYSHPPHHGLSQFGSHGGGPWSGGPNNQAFIVARYRAALLDDPFAAAFAETYEGDLTEHANLRRVLAWLREPMPDPRPLRE